MVSELAIPWDFFAGLGCTNEENFNVSIKHFHRAYEIYYLDKGRVTYFVSNNVYSVEKGEFVLIKPDVIHTTKYDESNHRRFLIYFKESFIKDFLELEPDFIKIFDSVHLRFDKINEKRAGDIMRRILAEYESENRSPVLLKCLLGELIKIFAENKNESIVPRVCESENKILTIIAYINEHYNSNISLESLAKVFYLNPSYLSRSFKEATGIGFKEYLTSVRLKEASLLLKNTNFNVSEICEQVGFSSQNHFCKTFKQAFGMSPLKFRKYS